MQQREEIFSYRTILKNIKNLRYYHRCRNRPDWMPPDRFLRSDISYGRFTPDGYLRKMDSRASNHQGLLQ
jgi:hypothetical protein